MRRYNPLALAGAELGLDEPGADKVLEAIEQLTKAVVPQVRGPVDLAILAFEAGLAFSRLARAYDDEHATPPEPAQK